MTSDAQTRADVVESIRQLKDQWDRHVYKQECGASNECLRCRAFVESLYGLEAVLRELV